MNHPTFHPNSWTTTWLASLLVLGVCSGTLHAQVPVTSGLEFWLKADSINGLTNGQAVSAWNDSSGNGNHATQTDGFRQPAYITNGFNNLPVVRFDGSTFVPGADYLDAGNGVNITGNNLTMFAVLKLNSASGEQGFLGTYIGGTGYFLGETDVNLDNRFTTFLGPGGHLYGGIGSSPATVGAPVILSARLDVPNAFLYTNAAQVATVGTASGITSSPTNLFVGYALGFNNYFQGDMAEVLIYSESLSDSDRFWVESYLADKYGLSIPEPGSVTLLGVGAVLLLRRRNRGGS